MSAHPRFDVKPLASLTLLAGLALTSPALAQKEATVELKAGAVSREDDRCQDRDFGRQVAICLERPSGKDGPCVIKLFHYDNNGQKVLHTTAEVAQGTNTVSDGYRIEVVSTKTSMLGRRQHCTVKVTR